MSLSGRNILGRLGEVNESVGEEHIGDIGGGQLVCRGRTYWGDWGRSMSLSGRNILGRLGEVNESVGEEHIGDIGGGQ